MGKLSLGHDRNQKQLQKIIQQADILVIDEAHNYLHDNLSDDDLTTYQALRNNRRRGLSKDYLDNLRKYVNQFIVRRTKKELNRMIEHEPKRYTNRLGHECRYPKTNSDV
ncbi:hypothetical protein LXM25_16360 [Dyadobacter sp. LJ53]|uniref:hypothetical protein n=1 Tax=Dyadobacter chenwenxiniae TaxID=2906456 RepID=UPI001F260ACC|nr:hypothetical protein [Dyadobacter chenwenxiniae]MCF0051643.1 hypothetical protein [Dyadobacter chenwenxiniae]